MRLLLLSILAAVSTAAPQYGYTAPPTAPPPPPPESAESSEETPAPYVYSAPRSVESDESYEIIPILRDTRVHEEDGTHNFEFETANGISHSQSGDAYGNKQGVISFTHPDGTSFEMSFVADENGFQPQSDALPVAPAFPHPIPDFVLRQIEKARLEDEAAAREAAASAQSSRYAAPAPTPVSRYAVPDSSEEDYRGKRDVPAYGYSAPRSVESDESYEIIPILRDTRVHEEDGTHNFEFETANGISHSQSGDAYGNKQGVISFTHPDGTSFEMSFVADENGFQPQSDALPVAPAFPHPIPDFVLRQIEKARLEDEAAAREAAASAQSSRYAAPAPTPSSRYAVPVSSEEYN